VSGVFYTNTLVLKIRSIYEMQYVLAEDLAKPLASRRYLPQLTYSWKQIIYFLLTHKFPKSFHWVFLFI